MRERVIQACVILLNAAVLSYIGVAFGTATLYAITVSTTYYISPTGADTNSGTSPQVPLQTIQRAVDLAHAGDVITLAEGSYRQDVVSRRDGTAQAPITITGPPTAVVYGGGKARVVEIHHDYITLQGFTIDGLHGSARRAAGYRNKLLYAIGVQPGNGVSGLRLLRMTFQNAGGECVRLRYFAQGNEVAHSTFRNCGVYAFRFDADGKNGEAIYIGTAPEQRKDGKNPTSSPDQSNNNWIHHNRFDSQGSECVDIKEAATGNIIEHNVCTGQRDKDSAGFNVRGNNNVLRHNESYNNTGAGIRLGGDTANDGIGNAVYANNLHDNQAGGIKLQRRPQAAVCGNVVVNNNGNDVTGTYRKDFDPTAPCPS
jgi:hypothetical protein